MLKQGRKKILQNRRTVTFCVGDEMHKRIKNAQRMLSVEEGENVSYSEVIRRAINNSYPDGQFDIFRDHIKEKSV